MLMTTVSRRDASARPPFLDLPDLAAQSVQQERPIELRLAASPAGLGSLQRPNPVLSPVEGGERPIEWTPAAGPEGDLVARLQRGDEAGYDVLVRQYGGAMLAVARRMLRNEDDAHEALQDAFLQAFRAIQHFRKEARLSTWLHRIVVNAALMRLRSASRRPEVRIDELLPQFDAEGQHAESIRPLPLSVDAALESAEIRAQVRACIAELPEQYRAVVVLRDLQELSTAEAASLLGISENAVKIRLHRAHQALRTLVTRQLSERSCPET
jgi:RNA polymerase sigma-70 factor (ECF subfamily)